jgi:hypothetical protein
MQVLLVLQPQLQTLALQAQLLQQLVLDPLVLL